MTTLYTRTFDLKDSLTDAEVLEQWRFMMNEVVPAAESVEGTRSVKVYSGAGALRADLTILWEMDDASVYERALMDAGLRKLLARFYGGVDLKTSKQSFRREVTGKLIEALSSGG